MDTQDYHTSIMVNATPHEAFESINSVTKWWTENLEGSSRDFNDEFTVRFGDVHYSKQKLVEGVPDKKVVWLVTDSKQYRTGSSGSRSTIQRAYQTRKMV